MSKRTTKPNRKTAKRGQKAKSPAKAPKAAKKTAAKRAGTPRKATGKGEERPNTNNGTRPARPSALNAAAEVLRNSGKPMNCKALIAAMAEQSLWTSPAGKTPHATLYAAMLREINAKGAKARFKKVERGLFAFNTPA